MKQIIIVVVSLLAIGLAGIGVTQLLSDNTQDDNTGTQPDTSTNLPRTSDDADEQQNIEEVPETTNDGAYVDYSDDAIANASGDTYLFFHASWCPQCRSIESGINTDGVPEGVTIIKVDYDDYQDLRKKYGVTLQTTFVKVTRTGDEISKFVAYNDPQFSSVVRDYIKS